MASIYIGNDHAVTLTGLVDSAGTPLTTASVDATLLHQVTLQEVAGETWPITMSHIADGEYTCVIDKAVDISRGAGYVLRVMASAGTSDAQWDIRLQGSYRT
jgi:hypothetical protein